MEQVGRRRVEGVTTLSGCLIAVKVSEESSLSFSCISAYLLDIPWTGHLLCALRKEKKTKDAETISFGSQNVFLETTSEETSGTPPFAWSLHIIWIYYLFSDYQIVWKGVSLENNT